MMTRPLDTAPEAWSAHHAILDRMGGSARVLAAIQLSEAVRDVRLAGIRARNPELDDPEVLARLIRELGLQNEWSRALQGTSQTDDPV